MYSLQIVEDELLVRLGIKVSIENSNLPVSIVSVEVDGQEAFESASRLMPDILITDLRLPGMDGLELIRRLRERGYEGKIVIISCIEDYETLHLAMSYQVSHYLTKATMTGDELTEALSQVVQELQSNSPLPAPKPSPSAAKDESEQSFCFHPQSAALFLIPSEKSNSLLVSTTIEILREKLPGVCRITVENNRVLAMLPSAPNDALREAIRLTLQYIQSSTAMKAYCAYTALPPDVDALAEAMPRIEALLADLRFFGVRSMAYERIEAHHFASLVCTIQELEGSLLKSILPPHVRMRYQAARSSLELSMPQGKQAFLKALQALLSACSMKDEEVFKRVARSMDAETALRAAYHALQHGLESSYRPEIQEIKQYVQENLGRPLTLHGIAARAGFNANYFSNLFKRETGESFVHYLNQQRLLRSKELLCESHFSIQEIAWQCGFRNENYFSRIFRQRIGMSPSRWRSMAGKNHHVE